MEVLVRLPDGTETLVAAVWLKTFLRLNPGAVVVDEKAVRGPANDKAVHQFENKSA